MKKGLLILIVITASISAIAQKGYLRGKIIDGENSEGLIGATISKQGTATGAAADWDGNYNLALDPGTHTVVLQFISYQTQTISDVVIKDGEVTLLDVTMNPASTELQEVLVTAEALKDNDIALLKVQKKSVNTVDGISSQAFRKVGDSDLGSAMKRVTGVSVQGDKYVYVRGLGDRYTKTSLNGMYLPGLDPDRNDVQIDIFPTGILENVIVYKTFTPDLPGSFTGGLVDIQTKSFPDEKKTTVSLGVGYNPGMHLRSDFLAYEGSPTDFLGFDNGQRGLPVAAGEQLAANGETSNLFDPTLAGSRKSNFLNNSFSLSHRNQIVGDKLTWGYNALFTYRNNNSYYEGFERRRYERDITGENTELLRDYTAVGDLASQERLWSGLATIAAKTDNTTIGVNMLHIQNGVSTALDRTRDNSSLNNPTFLYNDILTYAERQMTNGTVYGKHNLGDLKISWANSLIRSRQYEPDYRETSINEDDGQLGFRNGGLINRFWRDLSEFSENFKLDLVYDLNEKNTLKMGGAFTLRTRQFDVNTYSYANLLSRNVNSTDPNDLLADNLISEVNTRGLYIENTTDPVNAYDGQQTITAGYVMNEMQVSGKLKAIYGARIEAVKMLYSGFIQQEDGSFADENDVETLNEVNVLPSLNFIYAVNEDMNLRASFNKTLARPSFKEKSEAFVADPITAIFFIGNINVKQAEILNYDLRWEYFFGRGEMASLSFFYKDFTNHIALVAYDKAPNQVTPRNVGQAVAYGTEVELRKNLSMLGSVFNNFSAGGNFSYTISRVDRKTVIVSDTGENEYDSELEVKGVETGVDRYRNMSMQAPFSINTYLNYEAPNQGISANLSYNVQGETLTFVSARFVPEVYTKPFHSLNFKISKSLGEKSNLSLKIDNLIGDNNELVYKLDDTERLFSMRNPGRTFSLNYSYTF